jgi:DNA-binding SARP family transcriptional activator
MALVERPTEESEMTLVEERVATRTSLSVLRGFEVRAGSDRIALPLNGQRLVAYLAVRERPQLRTTVASSLWLDTTEARAAANLRTALWKIRQLQDSLVQANGNYLSLDANVDVDLARLLAQARRLISPRAEFEPSDADAETLSGDLLPDWDEEWIQFERERLRQLRVHALEALCRRLSQAGRHAEAIDAGQTAVAAEPLRESAQRTLIAAHLAEGNLCEARRQFGLYRDVLWDSLRLSPSEELQVMLTRDKTRATTTG